MRQNRNSIEWDFKILENIKNKAIKNGITKKDINFFLEKSNDTIFSIYLTNLASDSLKIIRYDSSIFTIQEAKNKEGKWKPIEYWPATGCGNSYVYYQIPPSSTLKTQSKVYQGDFKTNIRFKVNINDKVYYTNSLTGYINPNQFQIPEKIRGQELLIRIGGKDLLKKAIFLKEGSKREISEKYKQYMEEMMRKKVEFNKKKKEKKKKQ
ncbi:MAG TPA: hypothetical protein VFM65_04500 [Flavobacteriaceae bacterium]|nr:hypothetical protein [Flavobacteriaceae bacterium]